MHYSLAPLCMAMQLLALVVRPRGTYIRVSGECHSILLYSQSVPDKLTMCHTTHHGRTLGSHEARSSRRFPEAVFETSLLLHPIESAIDSPMSFACWHDMIGVRPLSTVEVRGTSGSSPGWVVSGAWLSGNSIRWATRAGAVARVRRGLFRLRGARIGPRPLTTIETASMRLGSRIKLRHSDPTPGRPGPIR